MSYSSSEPPQIYFLVTNVVDFGVRDFLKEVHRGPGQPLGSPPSRRKSTPRGHRSILLIGKTLKGVDPVNSIIASQLWTQRLTPWPQGLSTGLSTGLSFGFKRDVLYAFYKDLEVVLEVLEEVLDLVQDLLDLVQEVLGRRRPAAAALHGGRTANGRRRLGGGGVLRKSIGVHRIP